MTLTQDEIIRILKLVEESTFDELHLETGELKLIVKKGGCESTPKPVNAPHPGPAPTLPDPVPTPIAKKQEKAARPRAGKDKATQAATGREEIPIKAPLLGTVYRRPAPDSPHYVEIGSIVKEEDTVCLIEVMKVFTAVKAGVRGRIQEILVETNDMVEYGQPLFMVEPETGLS